MIENISATLFPSEGSTKASYIKAGLINLLVAATSFAIIITLGILKVGAFPWPSLGLISMILWCIGCHYLVWRGKKSQVKLTNAFYVVITAIIGFISVMAMSAVVGAMLALLKSTGAAL